MIIGCVIMFDDSVALVEACLKALAKVTDKIVVVDGAFAEFPHKNFNTTDGSLVAANIYADKIISAPGRAWHDQVEKRNAYLKEAAVGNYLVLVDTDEIITGKKPARLTKDVYKIKLTTEHGGMKLPQMACRLIKMTEGLHYEKKHNVLLDGKGKLISHPSEDTPLHEGLSIEHTPESRGAERLAKDGQYLRERAENDVQYDFEGRLTYKPPIKEVISAIKDKSVGVKRLKALHKYSGYDTDETSTSIEVNDGDFLTVSAAKAEQLLSDFPLWFTEA